MAKDTIKPKSKPPKGEDTKQQVIGMSDILSGTLFAIPGYGKPPPGTFELYRRMRRNPTVALARAVSTSPIKATPCAVRKRDDGSDDMRDFVKKEIDRLWPDLLHNVLFALDYGFAPFEKVWEVNPDGRWVYKKLKPLSVDMMNVKIDKRTGKFEGLKQSNAELQPQKCFLYTYDKECGNYFGRSRHENIREFAWHPWVKTAEKRAKYITKVSGVIPMIEYPLGESETKDGTKSNSDLAADVLKNLGTGHGVAMPNVYSPFAGDLQRSGADLKELKAWQISFLETKGRAGKEITDMMRHLEALMMRGWLIPERAAIEGQFGTKAESETQGKWALLVANLLLEDIVRHVNKYIVNPLLVYNFGENAKDSIYLESVGLDPLVQSFYQEVIKSVLANPVNTDLFLAMTDLNALFDKVGYPKKDDLIDLDKLVVPSSGEEKATPGSEAQAAMANILRRIALLTMKQH